MHQRRNRGNPALSIDLFLITLTDLNSAFLKLPRAWNSRSFRGDEQNRRQRRLALWAFYPFLRSSFRYFLRK